MSRTIKVPLLLTCLLIGLVAGVNAAPLLYDQPLSKKYHRLEVVVSNGFQANCTSKPKLSVCQLSVYNSDLLRVFQIGSKSGMTVEANERRKEIRFYFDDPRLKFQHKVLEGPPRWVIEVGYEEVLIQPIEDEIPFRPYPMPVQTIRLDRPTIALSPLIGEGPDVENFNKCWALWEQQKFVKAYEFCEKIDLTKDENRPAARATVRLKGEILFKYLRTDSENNQEIRKHVGTTVWMQGDRISLEQGKPVSLGFVIQGEAQSATLTIVNANGTRVYQGQVSVGEAGKLRKVDWNGEDLSKSNLPAGTYSFQVSASPLEPGGETPVTLTYIEGKVTGTRFDQGIPEFIIGNKRVRMGEVILSGKNTFAKSETQKFFRTDDKDTSLQDITIEHLKKAERAAESELEKARYVLLTSEIINQKSTNEAIEYLRSAHSLYQSTKAEPDILAERARLLLKSNIHDEAKRVLESIANLNTQQGFVMGSRILALASLAYAEKNYTSATALYDEAKLNFPELLLQAPSPIFQAAELYFRAKRLEEARQFYQEFLDRFKTDIPHWIVEIRLAQINSFERPLEAYKEMEILSENLKDPEGKQLAKLYMLTLSSNNIRGPTPQAVLKEVSSESPTDYVLEELLMQKARNALRNGELKEAFEFSQKIVETFSESSLLRDSSLFFQRLLLLEVDRLLREGMNVELVILYFKEKNRRFRQPSRRGLLHLYVARAMRELKMLDEAAKNVIAKGGLSGVRDPNIEALLNLELTGIFREKIQDRDLMKEGAREEINKFKQAVESINKRFPNRFDTYDYWASRGYYHELQGQLRQAKEIYLYALNGPTMKPHEMIKLARSIYEVYMKMPDYDKALHSLKILLQIYDEFKDQLNMPGLRVNVLWNRVELNIRQEKWPETIKGISEYLEESQGALSTLGTNQVRLNGLNAGDDLGITFKLELNRRREALFYHGYALLKLGLIRQAKRQWDLLYKEAPTDVYGRLAEYELRMLSWRDVVSDEIIKMIQP